MNTGIALSCLNILSSGPMCAIHISLGLQRVTEFPRMYILDLLSSAVNQPFVMSWNALKYPFYLSMVSDFTQVFTKIFRDHLVVVPFQTDGKNSKVSVF